MKTVYTFSFVGFLLAALSFSTSAQPYLDNSFGTGGVVVNSETPWSEAANAVLLQPDGKVIQIAEFWDMGNTTALITRNMANGAPDNSFGTSGKFVFDFGGTATTATCGAVLPDGSILVGGMNEGQAFVFKLNSDGTLNNTFGGVNGYFRTNSIGFQYSIKRMLIQPGGKIVLMGEVFNGSNWDIVALRITSDGFWDSSFDTDGIAQWSEPKDQYLLGASLDGAGKIVFLASYYLIDTPPYQTDYYIFRLNDDGSEDNTFGTAGFYKDALLDGAGLPYYGDVAVGPDGKIYFTALHLNASDNYDVVITRVTASGTLDNTYSTAGRTMVDFSGMDEYPNRMIFMPNGKLVISGFFSSSSDDYQFLIRLSSSGAVDSWFGPMGRFVVDLSSMRDFVNDMVAQPDGRLIVSGAKNDPSGMGVPDMIMARYIIDADFSVSESDMPLPFSYFPNPAGDEFFIVTEESFTLEIYNVAGRRIREFRILGSMPVSLEGFASGTYFLRVKETGATGRLIRR
jgi:uncharacterized delta-60 repeat protein